MKFTIDYFAAGVLLASLIFFSFIKAALFPFSPSPSLAFSRLADLKFTSWRSRWASLPTKLHLVAISSLMIAFLDPHFLLPKSSSSPAASLQPLPTEGIAMYLVLDQSGSMAQPVDKRGKRAVPKIDILKQVTRQFITDHPSDMIGLVSFARVPRVLVPLTLDRETLLKQLDEVQVIQDPENDGTAMGYAIFKTANLMAATRQFIENLRQERSPPYTIKSAVMIVVTDGFQDPSHLDQGNRLRTMELDEAAAYAKSQNIHLYVINIDPALATPQYAPHRRQLQAITTLTGGQFYLAADNQELEEMYTNIDKLEKGTIVQEVISPTSDSKGDYQRFSLYPFFIALGLCCLLGALLLDSMLLKIVP